MSAAASILSMNCSVLNNHTVRQIERESIAKFIIEHHTHLEKSVLDFGCGKHGTCAKPQPYRGLVIGAYTGVDKGDPIPNALYETVLCTQVLQYIENPEEQIRDFYELLVDGGCLLMTYPTHWAEAEPSDLWRFTKAGMNRMLEAAGFTVLVHELRAEIDMNGFKLALGYGVLAKKGRQYKRLTTLTEDESLFLLTHKIRNQQPFFFTKFGDGALECIYKKGAGKTCDGEAYTPQLASALQDCWDSFVDRGNVYLGDWLSASFKVGKTPDYYDEYLDLVNFSKPNWLHFECLLMMRKSQELVNFYRAVKADPRKKVLMGPLSMAPAAEALGCTHIVTPMTGLYEDQPRLLRELTIHKPQLLLWCAGMAGHISVTRYWKMNNYEPTCLSMGSALDPLFRGKTRKQQISLQEARELFTGVLT